MVESRPVALGVLIVCIMAASQTGAAELTSSALNGFSAPFFLMYLHTAFGVFVLPLLLASRWLGPRDADTKVSCAQSLRFLRLQLIFYPLWVVANYAYVQALTFTSPGVVTAVFGSCSAFVAVFSRYSALRESFSAARVASVLLAVLGVALVGADATLGASGGGRGGGSTRSFVGVSCALLSSLAAAAYKVWFKVYLPGKPDPVHVALFLCVLSVVNIVVGAVPLVGLGVAGAEDRFWETGEEADWGAVVGGSVLTLVFNFAIAIGISVTYPLFIAVGTVITIPSTLVVDYIARDEKVGYLAITGAVLICLSFGTLVAFGGDQARRAARRELCRPSTPTLAVVDDRKAHKRTVAGRKADLAQPAVQLDHQAEALDTSTTRLLPHDAANVYE